jgi:hypothetical protein
VDQLERSKGLSADRIRTLRNELADAEKASGSSRRSKLTELATSVTTDAAASSDRARVEKLATALRELAGTS